jgi:hypothetical protein
MTPNAITKTAALVSSLADAKLPVSAEPAFPLPPRLTVTESNGVPLPNTRCAVVRCSPRLRPSRQSSCIRTAACT